MMTHRSKKPFECKFEGCDKSYCDSRSLRRHVENHHQQDVEAVRQLQLQAVAGGGGGGQSYFQFDPQYRQQFQNSSLGGGGGSHAGDHSPGYLQQVSPITPTHPNSPLNPSTTRALWPPGFNPLE